MRIRIIALENLVISLLATEDEREVVGKMAAYISPRGGRTHRMTTLASAHMIDLLKRARRFEAKPEGGPVC